MAHSPHKRWKGDCMMCAAWIRGDGKAKRLPFRDLRRLGTKRRIHNPRSTQRALTP